MLADTNEFSWFNVGPFLVGKLLGLSLCFFMHCIDKILKYNSMTHVYWFSVLFRVRDFVCLISEYIKNNGENTDLHKRTLLILLKVSLKDLVNAPCEK